MPSPLPRRSGWTYSSLVSPCRISLPRKGCRVGLRIVLFEACSAFTHVAACTLARSPIRDPLPEGFSHFVSSMTAPVASGGSEIAGWAFHPLERCRLVTLDIDDTMDVVHGHQQLSLFNAHYDERCFLPIHVYDTATGRPAAVILRP